VEIIIHGPYAQLPSTHYSFLYEVNSLEKEKSFTKLSVEGLQRVALLLVVLVFIPFRQYEQTFFLFFCVVAPFSLDISTLKFHFFHTQLILSLLLLLPFFHFSFFLLLLLLQPLSSVT